MSSSVVHVEESGSATPVALFVQLDRSSSEEQARSDCSVLGMELAAVCCEQHTARMAVASTNCTGAGAPGYCMRHNWTCSSTAMPANASHCSPPETNATVRTLSGQGLREVDLWPLCLSGVSIPVPRSPSAQAAAVQLAGTGNASVPAFPAVVTTVELTSEPTAPVFLSANHGGDVHVWPNASTAFTAADWSTPRYVVVSAVDDYLAEQNQESHRIIWATASRDSHYNRSDAFSLNVTILDNDAFRIVIEMSLETIVSQGAILLDEAGTVQSSGSYLVSLGSQPSSQVTVRAHVWPDAYQAT